MKYIDTLTMEQQQERYELEALKLSAESAKLTMEHDKLRIERIKLQNDVWLYPLFVGAVLLTAVFGAYKIATDHSAAPPIGTHAETIALPPPGAQGYIEIPMIWRDQTRKVPHE